MKIGIYPKPRTSITLAARWLIAERVEMKGQTQLVVQHRALEWLFANFPSIEMMLECSGSCARCSMPCRGVFPRSLTRRMHPECGPTVVQ